MGIQVFDEGHPVTNAVLIDDSVGLSDLTAFDAGTFGARCDQVLATNTDTIDHVVAFKFNQLGTVIQLGSVTVPAGSGTLGTPAVDCWAALLPATAQSLLLGVQCQLLVAVEVAVVPTFAVGVLASGGTL